MKLRIVTKTQELTVVLPNITIGSVVFIDNGIEAMEIFRVESDRSEGKSAHIGEQKLRYVDEPPRKRKPVKRKPKRKRANRAFSEDIEHGDILNDQFDGAFGFDNGLD